MGDVKQLLEDIQKEYQTLSSLLGRLQELSRMKITVETLPPQIYPKYRLDGRQIALALTHLENSELWTQAATRNIDLN